MGVIVVHGRPLETMLGLSWSRVSGGRCMRWYVPDSESFVIVGGGGRRVVVVVVVEWEAEW